MLPAQVTDALQTLAAAIDGPQTAAALHAYWTSHGHEGGAELDEDVRAAARLFNRAMPGLSRSASATGELCARFDAPEGEVAFRWCAAAVSRGDARMAPFLHAAAKHEVFADRVVPVARDRLVQGPLMDALACAPLLGEGDRLALPENEEARARLEILIWEAGASAQQVPALGQWVWGSRRTFEAMIENPARGSLRGRVLSARCLEICVSGMPQETDPELIGQTLQTLQPLLLHPEPLVSLHAARALGRLAGAVEQLEGTLLDWVQGSSPVLRERAMTAFASLPAARLRVLGHELTAALDTPEDEAWVFAAAAAGTPYLLHERRELWDDLAARILAGKGGPAAARSLARGLATLWRRDTQQAPLIAPLRELREMARRARADRMSEWRQWLSVLSATDPVDGAERDPLDVEQGLENLVHLASQYDDEEADARAARFAASLARTFEEAREVVLSQGSARHRAAGLNALEGCARSMALSLWRPQLETHPRGERVPEPPLAETWQRIARAPTEFLDVVRERRDGGEGEADQGATLAMEVLAVQLGSYALDACGEEGDLGPGRGPAAHDICLWLRKIDGVADGARELPAPLRKALSGMFWRLVDTTRGTALGAVDDVRWLGPFAAWWALVIDRPEMLQQLATALPLIADGALDKCCALAETIRNAVGSGEPDGEWGRATERAFEELHAADTELAHALTGLAECLGRFAQVSGPKPELQQGTLELVLAAERLQAALADPVKALHPARSEQDDSLARASTENAPRVAALMARAIRSRDLSLLDVWLTSLGPVTSAMVEQAVRGAASRTPPPPPVPKKPQPQTIEGYELVKQLGEGGIGKIWMVRKPGADRLFVLKIPKADALAGASDTEREGILASFVEEARALAGLYHPNVANIIDRGVSGNVPFLVLELLIGADLKEYAAGRLLSLFELRQIVLESCAGLAALHGAGLVHRDIKPANLWLRLPLASGERFEADKHRDPGRTPLLSTVVIDFGMVRAKKVSPEVGGRFVAGTPGYIAPEQVLDPVELDGRADVYSLAGCIYNVTTGRAFFDDEPTPRDRIFAHMKRDPLEDAKRLDGFPSGLVKLMRAATALNPKDRPHPLEFAREFAAQL